MEMQALNKKFQKEINAGVTGLVLLSVLGQSTEPMYGYQIAKLLGEVVEGEPFIKQGAMYPVLRSLEKNGLLESSVQPSASGPPRRYYAITGFGRDTLKSWEQIWAQTGKFVEDILQGVRHD